MPGAVVTRQMPEKSAVVFALLHDYERRLEWDTLLKSARLTRGSQCAEKGATSLCVGKLFFGLVGMETRYVSFYSGTLAAVTLINRPPFFESFAASIRHEDNEEGSLTTYHLRFRTKPRLLRWLFEPILLVYLRHETGRRLDALATHL